MNVMKNLVSAIALLGVAPVLTAQSTSPADPSLDLARTKYSPDQWPKGERRDGFVLEDLALPGLSGLEVEFRADDVARTYADANGVKRVLVEMIVRDAVADVHTVLLHHLANVQSANTLATTASRGIQAGDVGYVAYGGKDRSKIAWVAFVVGNLEFRVMNLAPDADGSPDLKPLVEILSARAQAQPALPAGAAVSGPTVAKFSAEQTTFPAGNSVLLDVGVVDPTDRPARFDFVIGGPNQGQGYVENDENGRPRFFATKHGRTTLTLRALGSNGTVTTRSLTLELTRS